ncbi:hypothetical protein ACHAXN_003470 [Cyclotella atomus]
MSASTRASVAAACRRMAHNFTSAPAQRNNHKIKHISHPALSPQTSAQHHISLRYSTNKAISTAGTKKSPHSKLLRVCSNRNLNRHFAAIEADILQLDWDKAIKALTDDWVKNNKWEGFTELESNIRSYVDKNLPFLVLNWKKRQEDTYQDVNEGMQLSDRIRMNHFPYEQVILAAAKHAISGQVVLDGKIRSEGRKVAEMEARRAILLEAGKMLKSMADFSMEREARHQDEWTLHHESCSACFKAIVSSWFLLWRRMRGVQQQDIDDSSPEIDQMYTSAMEWISFCTNGQIVERSDELQVGGALMGGITHSDKTLLLGVTKGLALSKDGMHQVKSTELQSIIDRLL